MRKRVVIGIVVAFFIVLVFIAQTEPVLNKTEDIIIKTTNGFVRMGDIKGNVLFRIKVYDLNIGEIITVDTMTLHYSPLSLILRGIHYIDAKEVIINTAPATYNEVPDTSADRGRFVFPVDVDRFKIKRLKIREIPNVGEVNLSKINGTGRRIKGGVSATLHIGEGEGMNIHICEADGIFLYKEGRFILKEMWVNTQKSRFLINTSFGRGEFDLNLRSSKIALTEFAHFIAQDISGYLFGNLDVKREKKFSGKGSFTVKDVAYRGYTINSGNVRFSISDDIVDATFENLSAYNGQINGVMSINLFPFSYKSYLSLSDIDTKEVIGNVETSISGEASISGNLDKGKIELNLSGSVGGRSIESVKGRVSFGEEFLIEDIIVNDRLSLQGRLNGRKLDVCVFAEKFDISPFLPIAGILNGDGKIMGTFEHPVISGFFYIEDFHYKLLQAKYISSNFNIETLHKPFLGGIDFTVAQLDAPGAKFNNIEGKIFASDDIVFSVKGEGEDISLSIFGDMHGDDICLDTLIYSTGDVILKNTLPVQLRVNLPSVFIDRCVVAVDEGYVECRGRYDPEDMDLTVIGEEVSIASLRRDIKGKTSVWMKLKGGVKSPSIQLEQRIVNMLYSGIKIDTVNIRAGYTQDLLTIDEVSIVIKGERSEIKGNIPINLFPFSFPEKHMNIDVTLKKLPPDVWKPLRKYVIIQAGTTDVNLAISGTPRSPDIRGYIDLKELTARVPLYGVSFTDLYSRIHFSQEKVEIESFTAKSKEGELGLKGHIIVSTFSRKGINLFLDLDGKDIPLLLPEGKGVVDMNIGLRGTLAYPVITGNVELDEALVTVPIGPRPLMPPGQEFDLDLTVDMPERVWIKSPLSMPISPIPEIESPVVDLEVGGKVSAIKRGKEIFLTGAIEVKQGYFYYIDRPFEVMEGNFLFDNTVGFDPLITLTAKSDVIYTVLRGEEVRLDTTTVYISLEGRLSQPQFSMYSEPDLPLESIIVMLSLDAPLGEFNVANVPDRLLNLLIRGTVLADVEKLLGVDALWLETSLFGEEKMAKITAGKYISPDLYASYTKDIFSPSWSFKTRYRILREVSLIGERTEEDEYNVGMEVEIRY